MREDVVEANEVLATWASPSEGSACHLDLGRDHWMADIAGAECGHATPHQILDAALASCTVLTLELFAKHKGWQVARICVAVSHKHEEGVYRLERRIRIEGDLNPEQRATLLRAAQACPLHKTLTGDIAINTAPA